jgi:hypothetical protein
MCSFVAARARSSDGGGITGGGVIDGAAALDSSFLPRKRCAAVRLAPAKATEGEGCGRIRVAAASSSSDVRPESARRGAGSATATGSGGGGVAKIAWAGTGGLDCVAFGGCTKAGVRLSAARCKFVGVVGASGIV